MSNTSYEKKERTMRILAVAGLVAIIIFIAWLSVRIINVVPNAFSSLASIADGISQYEDSLGSEEGNMEETLLVANNTELLESGEVVSVTWDTVDRSGNYSFTYGCTEGVAVAVRSEDGDRPISCDTTYNLGTTQNVSLLIDSKEERYVNVPYSVSFQGVSGSNKTTGEGLIAVVNRTIDGVDGEVAGENTSIEDVAVVEEVAPTTPTQTTQPEPTVEYTYAVPTSNPNGIIDLSTRFINVGGTVNGRFVAGTLEKNSTGALQFEVKNIGTKTSNTWKFTVTLPDGSTYESDTQRALKPNERSILSLGVDTNNSSSHVFNVTIISSGETRTTNNSFSQRITLVN